MCDGGSDSHLKCVTFVESEIVIVVFGKTKVPEPRKVGLEIEIRKWRLRNQKIEKED